MFTHEPTNYVCPFCGIIAGRREPPAVTSQSEIVLRDTLATAFMALEWRVNNPGHVLVVPNDHVENIYSLPYDTGAQIQDLTRRIAVAMKHAYGCDGVSTVQHNEPSGNQHVWHYHVHVFPRYNGDDIYRSPVRETTNAERDQYAGLLRAVLLEKGEKAPHSHNSQN